MLEALIAAEVPLEPVHREGLTLLYQAPRTGKPLVLLAGHLDTVPPQGNLPGRLDGDVVHGLGAADMKAGLAVMIELARWVAERASRARCRPRVPLLPARGAAGRGERDPGLFATGLADDAELVVVLEPTANAIQAGCLGHIAATLVFEGRSGHSARPWLAENAIDRAVRGTVPARRPAAARRRALRPRLPRGAVRDAAPRGDRRERGPGARRGDAQLPLRARPYARGGGGRAAAARRGRRHARRHRQLARRAGSSSTRRSRARCARQEASRSSRSRRGRRWRSSPSTGSTRSTSGPATPATRTRPTSRSTSRRARADLRGAAALRPR